MAQFADAAITQVLCVDTPLLDNALRRYVWLLDLDGGDCTRLRGACADSDVCLQIDGM